MGEKELYVYESLGLLADIKHCLFGPLITRLVLSTHVPLERDKKDVYELAQLKRL